MKHLTKADFTIGQLGKEMIEQILKNQEIAEKWNKVVSGSNGLITTPEEISKWKEDSDKWNKYMYKYCEKDMTCEKIDNALEIEERMKKRIEWYVKDNQRCSRDGYHGTQLHYDAIIEELQKILGEEKLKFSFKWDETYYGGAENGN